jgi:hypothetical protein
MMMIRWTYIFNTPRSSVESQSGSPVTPYKYYSIHYRTVEMSFGYICRTIKIQEKSGKHQMGNCDFNMKRCCTSSTVQINLGNMFPEKFPGKTCNKENSENGVSSIWSISSSCNRLTFTRRWEGFDWENWRKFFESEEEGLNRGQYFQRHCSPLGFGLREWKARHQNGCLAFVPAFGLWSLSRSAKTYNQFVLYRILCIANIWQQCRCENPLITYACGL